MKKTFSTLKKGDEVYMFTYWNIFFKGVVKSVVKTHSCLQLWIGYKCYNIPLNHMNANRVKVGHTMLYLAKKQFKRDVVKRLNELTK